MLQVEHFRRLAITTRNLAAQAQDEERKAHLAELALDYERKARSREIELLLEAGDQGEDE